MSAGLLNGALLVKVYGAREDNERVYAWFGSSQIHVYEWVQERLLARLVECDVFTNYDLTEAFCPQDELTLRAERLIEEYEDEHFMRAPHTEDIFYAYEWAKGVDLETQYRRIIAGQKP